MAEDDKPIETVHRPEYRGEGQRICSVCGAYWPCEKAREIERAIAQSKSKRPWWYL